MESKMERDSQYYKDVNDACNYLSDYSRIWGRLGGQVKDKYDTIRFYASFGNLSLHGLLYPRHYYNQLPWLLNKLDYRVITPILEALFSSLFIKWQYRVYDKAYQGALLRWPNLRKELLCGADWPELITGATRVEMTKTHKIVYVLGWYEETLSKCTSQVSSLDE